MKKHMITALLITTMISMTACGNNNTDTPAETTVATEATGELPTANDEKVVLGTVNKEETATAETTAEEKTDAKATATPDPKATEAPKSTQAPETTAKPKSTTKPGTQTASVTATTKPAATEKPKSTTAPKATATPAPKATATPVACQHIHTHVENGHDTENVPIAGGCYEVYNYSTTICNDCGANLGEAKNKVNEVHHGCVITEGVSATCTTDGRTTVWGCDCGGSGTTGGDVIPAFGHDYKDVCTGEVSEDLMTVKYESVCRNCGDVAKTWWE